MQREKVTFNLNCSHTATVNSCTAVPHFSPAVKFSVEAVNSYRRMAATQALCQLVLFSESFCCSATASR